MIWLPTIWRVCGKELGAVYNADIKHLVEPEHKNKYLVLNVDTGDYEIDARLGAGQRSNAGAVSDT